MNGGKVSGIALRRELMTFAKMRQKRADRIADQITAFAGSLQFVYIHVAWFTAWIITAHERINQARASRPWRRQPVRERDGVPGDAPGGIVTPGSSPRAGPGRPPTGPGTPSRSPSPRR